MKFELGDTVYFIYQSELGRFKVTDCEEDTLPMYQIARSGWTSWVRESDLALVKLPRIPQYVADWFEEKKNNLESSIWSYIYCDMREDKEYDAFYDFMNSYDFNPIETLIMMQYGYYVEKEVEPIYYVKLADSGLDYLNVNKETGQKHVANNEELTSYKTRFTESEIKDINENYWAFRVPVEEVEGE
ncbi:DUF1642 domain-containing protein [Listeria innocua]